MKIILILSILLGLHLASIANPVEQATAKANASKFIGTNELQLATTYTTDKNVTALFIFNTKDGFVIVSADDCETPIIGYSHEACFDPDNVPMQLEAYLQDFVAKIQYGIENQRDADPFTANQWERVKSIGKPLNGTDSKATPPLLTNQWHQGCLYNSLCPLMQGPCGHAEVGCVAVAMGQIMHYWGYPSTGWGSNSYHYAGNTYSADFGSTTYHWDLMPDSLNEQSSQAEVETVATLLYHCGVAVNMKYSTNGSTAGSELITDAFVQHFDYGRHLRLEYRRNYSDVEWNSMLKECLDQGMPILYSGYGTGGHAFVCDGYDSNDLFHFNWGWGGPGNGYFSLENLNPIGYNFSDSHFAIFDIAPHYEPCQVEAMVFPTNAGSIEGAGAFHHGEQCTLIATPTEGFTFYGWKIDGEIVSKTSSYTFTVKDDIDIEADFSFRTTGQISACITPDGSPIGSSRVELSWTPEDPSWTLLKQFKLNRETSGIATDGEFIYIAYAPWNYPSSMFEKYTMDGVLVEAFNLDGIPAVIALTYDGADFYCNSLESWRSLDILYRLDLEHKTILDSILMDTYAETLAYDPVRDGFWISQGNRLFLIDRQGHKIQSSPISNDYIYGTGYATAKDGSSHLLLVRNSGIYNYDIDNHAILPDPLPLSELVTPPNYYGACTGKCDEVDAFFFTTIDSILNIYMINPAFPQFRQIVHYRIFRSNLENEILTLADTIMGFDYIDSTWKSLPVGQYQYGICSVFSDGNVTETVWSDTLVKTDYGIGESSDERLSVFPNPVNDKLILEHDRPILRCEVFSLEGKEMYHATPCSKRIELSTQHWSSGTYLLRITTDDGKETRQVIKSKK